ncbi:DUF3558 domain-containing protein [Nocardia sp. NPDC059177]|uniref:DUF3558 domain-containing protein n=1 Tax=Nocardia sp. NPDC059177 TaxID=3346759 RepID=UPI00368586BC
MRLVGVVAGACAVLALAGCSKAVDGQPEASGTPLTKEQLFDPCSVPDDVVLAAGADPASKNDNPFAVEREEWKGCTWRAGEFFLSLLNTTKSMLDFRKNTYIHDFVDVTVGGRNGVQYLIGESNPPEECGIVFDSSQGRITLQAALALGSRDTTDSCQVAKAAGPNFVEVLPE